MFGRALFDNQPLPDRTVYWRSDDEKAVRKGPWKYIETTESQYLFNLETDLSEQINLLNKKHKIAAALKYDLADWEKIMDNYQQKSER